MQFLGITSEVKNMFAIMPSKQIYHEKKLLLLDTEDITMVEVPHHEKKQLPFFIR